MRKFICNLWIVLSICISQPLSAQTIKSFEHDSLSRKYMEFVPASYNGSQAVPLLFVFHGLGDTITNFNGVGFQNLGQTDNFITVYPQGVQGFAGTAWNAGVQYFGITVNGDIDDIGFINALLDSLISQYNIDQTKIYAAGFSMGGFMANRLACEVSHRFAAVACAAGSRGNLITNCTPWRAVPYCHLHGNQDGTVSFSGNLFGMDPPNLIEWWVTYNQCTTTPVITPMPDNVADNISVIHYEYTGGTSGSVVEFYLADGADHQWLYPPVNDVSYTILIWDFLKRFSLTNLSTDEYAHPSNCSIFPAVVDDYATITYSSSISGIDLFVYNIAGQFVHNQHFSASGSQINLSDLPVGMYMWKALSDNQIIGSGKIIIQH